MKTTIFTNEHMRPTWSPYGLKSFHVRTLSAYAIEFAVFTPPKDLDSGYAELNDGSDFQIEGNEVIFGTPLSSPMLRLDGALARARLVINYHGIRDYKLLFPQVTEESLQVRLARFYEEAERVFDTGSWLSFALMASAVYEGLLGWSLDEKNATFSSLIKKAYDAPIVDAGERDVLEAARKTRNLVHASNHEEAWVSRAQAMDMRSVLDKLVRSLSIVSPPIESEAVSKPANAPPSNDVESTLASGVRSDDK